MRFGLVCLFFFGWVAAAQASPADEWYPRGIYIPVELIEQPIAAPLPNGDFRTLYLNRGGGTYCCGDDASSTNSSSVACNGNQTTACGGSRGGTLTPNMLSDAEWDELVRCVKIQFGRFRIVVTDQEPASGDYVEAAVAGTPDEIGFGPGVGGVAPFTCDIVETAVVYTFAGVYPGNPRAQCETTAQEVAHAYGLDHEFYCTDPMTYLDGCGDKWFQDVAVPCGEYSARTCLCGAATQNSVVLLRDRLGVGEIEPPVVNITSPADGATVPHEFTIQVDATDNYLLYYVEFWIDGQLVRTVERPPFTMNTAAPVAGHTLEVRAYDAAFNMGSDSAAFTIMAECSVAQDCAARGENLVCTDSLCVGGLGAVCVDQADCDTDLFCAAENGENLCTHSCASGAECPGGYACLQGQFGAGKCWPGGGGGSCAVLVGRRASGLGLGALALLALCAGAFISYRRRVAARARMH